MREQHSRSLSLWYYSDSNCRWLIEAQAPNQKVVLFIEDFNTEEDFDFLYIYDGNTGIVSMSFEASYMYK